MSVLLFAFVVGLVLVGAGTVVVALALDGMLP